MIKKEKDKSVNTKVAKKIGNTVGKKAIKQSDNEKDEGLVLEPLAKTNLGLKKTLAIIIFFSIMIIGFLIYIKETIVIDKGVSIGVASFSILFNVIVLLVLFASGMGQDILGRMKRRLLFPTGKYVNVLYVSKNGPIREFFKAVDSDTGSFKIFNNTYVRNPSLMHHFKKLPTYVYREGNPDPLNLFESKLAGEISESEIDAVMMNKGAFDFKQWIKQNAMLIGFGALIIIGAAAFAGYTGMMNMQMLRDGTYTAVQCIQPIVELAANTTFLG